MRHLLFVLLFLSGVLIAGCQKPDCEAKPDFNCLCTLQYDPVCGCDGETYGNACSAECNGITDYTKGECK